MEVEMEMKARHRDEHSRDGGSYERRDRSTAGANATQRLGS
jgi:hypothetical protein